MTTREPAASCSSRQTPKPARERQCDAWHPDRRLRCAQPLGHRGNHFANFDAWPECAAIHLDDEEGKP